MNYRIINALVDHHRTEIFVCDGKICRERDLTGVPIVIDAGGASIHAGLVEIHAHGCLGYDTMEGHLREMAAFEFSRGVTTWMPTTMTMPVEAIREATDQIPDRADGESKIPGFHMEGPYVSAAKCGAQNREYLRNPSLDEFRKLRNILMVTVAPELPGAEEFISGAGVVVSLGHSEADYECGVSAFRNGARCLTHACNAMPPLLHREPSLIGAAIMEDGYIQVICDGIHIHRAMVLALYRMFGPERMILISDSIRAAGLADGTYSFGGQQITVRDSVARTGSGALAGSTVSLHDCVRKAIAYGIPEDDAYRMASRTPSELMGWKKGRILPGYDAEFVLTDQNGTIIRTLILE